MKDQFSLGRAIMFFVAVLGLVASANVIAAPKVKFGKGAPFKIRDLPPGLLKKDLQALRGSERSKAMRWLHTFDFPAADADVLRVDQTGAVYVADMILPDPEAVIGAALEADSFGYEAITADESFSLHSNLGASKVIFLDFDGHTITGTAWNSGYRTLEAKPYDTDGDPETFSSEELSDIAEMWHRIAEDYAPFDVDVTTQEPAVFDRYTVRMLITESSDLNGKAMPSSGSGGVAYVGVYGHSTFGYYSPALVYVDNLGNYPPYVAEAASHEIGHNMGLSHDGVIDGSSYYGGHGSDQVSWAPIMGTSYGDNVSQWSQGEYPNANNTQDDIAIIGGKVGLQADDHGDTVMTATELVVEDDGAVLATHPQIDPFNDLSENKGVINSRADVDVFHFSVGVGEVALTVTPAWLAWPRPSRGANLDVQISLLDGAGNVLASDSPSYDTDAHILVNVSAGDYYLTVTGVGSDVSPYNDYGSQGRYYIEGQLPVAGVAPPLDITAPNPNPMGWAEAPAANGSSSVSMTAVAASDDSGDAVQYYFRCVSGGVGCSDSGWQSSSSYTATGLQANTSYSWRVRARDASGNETVESLDGTAVTEPDTTAPTPNPMSWAVAPAANGSSSVSMTAVAASDDSGDAVEYYFRCVSGGVGCDDSGWQSAASYTDNGLQPGVSYSWRVRARDAAGNETAESLSGSATTIIVVDTTPPNPNLMSWSSAPSSSGTNAISMTATLAVDNVPGTVEYYFDCVAGAVGCVDSGWQASRTYMATGLQAQSTYSWTVRARDVSGNTTMVSVVASATTDSVPDTAAPNPNPMTWSVPPQAMGENSMTMVATVAVDASGSVVQYYFSCVSGDTGCADSGWQSSTSYTASGLQPGKSYGWRVRARDAAGNETVDSSMAMATTDEQVANQPPAMPSHIMAQDNRNGSVTVSWQDNSNNEVHFIVERESWYKKRDRWRANDIAAETDANVTSILDIEDRGTFRYRVWAENDYGSSAKTTWVEVTATRPRGGCKASSKDCGPQ